MTLEFHKLTSQVDRMGEVLASQEEELESKADIALQILEAHADEAFLSYIHERVQDAVDKDAGYRGARPIDEPIADAYSVTDLPESATVVATDGSQIPPNRHGVARYYLINTGTIIVHHGSGDAPEIFSDPALYYEQEYLRTEERGQISAATVAARRTVAEMAALAEHTYYQRGEARPLIALLDNPLLLIGMGHDVPDRDQLRGIYFSAMNRLLDVRAALAGYTDRPGSRYVISMLHLLDLEAEQVRRVSLSNDGRLEGLQDWQVFRHILRPGERSALFIQMSPQNKEFRQIGGETHEIAFFYLNVAAPEMSPTIARVEIPMWVAEDQQMIAELQALIYHQCQQVASKYPYVLTRAHELAVVKHEEARQLDMMIRMTMTRFGLDADSSDKQKGKDALGGQRTRFQVG